MLIITWLLITGFFGIQLTTLKVDFEFEKFFPTDDPDIQFYQTHLDHFAYDNDYIILILTNESGIFQQEFLKTAQKLSDSLSRIDGILNVFSPITLQQPVRGPMGITPIPLIHTDNPERYHEDSTKIYQHPIYRTFFSSDGHSVLLQLNHEHFKDPKHSKEFSELLTRVISSYSFDDSRLVGKLIAQDAFVSYIQNDFVLFLVAALILSFILLVLIFRSLKIALLPYLISVTSLIWLLGLMAWLNYPITILGTLIPPVILFVATSDAIHLINAFRNLSEKEFIKRIQLSVNKVFIPTMLTSVTTAIGFLSLMTIDTVPIQHLGIFAALGIIIAIVVTFTFAPLLINREFPERKPSRKLKRAAIWILRNQKVVLSSWIVITALSVLGISQLKTDVYLLKDLPENSQVRKDFSLVDNQFGGSKPWEMAIWAAQSKSVWSYQVILELDKVHAHIANHYPMERLLSPVTLIKYANQMLNGGLIDAYEIPEEKDFKQTVEQVKRLQKRGLLPELTTQSGEYGRLAGFIPEYGSYETTLRNKELEAFIRSEVDSTVLMTKLTGTTYLIDKSHEMLSMNLIKGLLIGIGIISLLLGLYFRSFKVLLISIIPNIIPLLAVAGYMGLTDAPLKLTTSVIFAVAFGIAVDDTIHFLAVYQRCKNKSSVWKIVHTFTSAGKAIILTTVIIVGGFFLFTLSSFGATYYLGLFMTISLLIALLTDLTILPLQLHLFQKTRK
ncbi:MAG: MMPL family transporter [Marinoscillum sp.]